MLIIAGQERQLGVAEPAVAFAEEPKEEGSWAGRRFLTLNGAPAFELSYWCGTCPLIFRRLEGAKATVSREAIADVLTEGIIDVDDSVISAFNDVLEAGTYLPLLLEIQPRLVLPTEPADYFAEEQLSTWGLNGF